MPRPLVTAVLALALALGVVAGTAVPALATDEPTTTTAVDGGQIIPEPNTGREPEDAGDRGGSLQTALFVGIVIAVAGAGGYLAMQSRRARAERGF